MRFLNRLAVAALALASAHAAAQNWPAKPIRVYTSAPGGPYDTVMRGLGVPLRTLQHKIKAHGIKRLGYAVGGGPSD